jgi:hypothetical protein
MCTLCCLLLKIKATNSPENQSCEHQTAHGCSIHGKDNFSDECHDWHCDELSGNMVYYFYTKAAELGLITEEEAKEWKSLLIIP